MTMPYEREKLRKIKAIEAHLARRARASNIVMGIMAALGAVCLSLVLALLFGLLEFPEPQ